MADQFTEYYQDFLDGSYDCVDRIVLTAYNPYIQNGGGFRTWWRTLNGSDANLDNTHLMRFSGHFSRRLRAYAKKNRIPLIYCEAKTRKDEIASTLLPELPDKEGVFAIMINRAPASVIDVQLYGKGGINIRKKEPRPYVNHYAFHIIDKEWGHLIIRFCPHPPFNAMIILNGHEYVERKARACSIPFTKVDNCFTDVPNAAALAGIADTMTFSDGGGGRLADVCERWIYSTCLCFALELADQQKTAFTYAYSVFQAEYSRNLLFTRGHILDKVFDSVIDRTRTTLDMRSVKTIFGRRNRPKNLRKHTRKPRFEIVVEKPTYNLTVFKIHFGKLTVKMYSKGERVLRIEAIAHNTADLRKGRSIQRFTEIIQKLASIVDSFLDKVHCVDVPTIHDLAPDEWYKPGTINGHRVSGVDVNKPRTRAFMQALTALSISPKALSAATVAAKVREMAPDECSGYTVRQAAYDLRKFRAKGLITKKDRGKTYHITDEALRVITAYFIIRDKVIIPVLQCCGDRKRIKTNQKRSKADIHIAHMQKNMIELFSEFRMVA